MTSEFKKEIERFNQRKGIVQKFKEAFGKGFEKGFEMTSKKQSALVSSMKSFEERMKDVEGGKLTFFSDEEIPVLKCSEKYSEWVALGLPEDFKIKARGHVFGRVGNYIKRKVQK